MFSKAKAKKKTNKPRKNSKQDLVEVGFNDAPQANNQTARMMSNNAKKPAHRPSGVPSLISADVLIIGQVDAAGEVQFDGSLEGDLKAKGLVIGESSTVKGHVIAEKVKVHGTVDGAIRANEVILAATALVKGDVIHSALSIETGARFEGNCRHSDDPMNAKTAPGAAHKAPLKSAPRPAPTTAENQAAEPPAAPMAEVVSAPVVEEAPAKAPESTGFLSRKGKADLR